MHWFLVHTKPRQEKNALWNLEQQGYQCYLPILRADKLCQGEFTVIEEPLFPRYLFIRLGQDGSAKSWSPIRSTRGVSRLVSFGPTLAKVDDGLIDTLKAQEMVGQAEPKRLFNEGERVQLCDGPFAGIEGIYKMTDGERRVLVLIEFLSKPVSLRVPPASVRKVA